MRAGWVKIYRKDLKGLSRMGLHDVRPCGFPRHAAGGRNHSRQATMKPVTLGLAFAAAIVLAKPSPLAAAPPAEAEVK